MRGKKIFAVAFAAALALGAGVSAFAQAVQFDVRGNGIVQRIMFDQNGVLLSQAEFQQRLNQAVSSGIVSQQEREQIVALYEWQRQFGAASNTAANAQWGCGCGGGLGAQRGRATMPRWGGRW